MPTIAGITVTDEQLKNPRIKEAYLAAQASEANANVAKLEAKPLPAIFGVPNEEPTPVTTKQVLKEIPGSAVKVTKELVQNILVTAPTKIALSLSQIGSPTSQETPSLIKQTSDLYRHYTGVEEPTTSYQEDASKLLSNGVPTWLAILQTSSQAILDIAVTADLIRSGGVLVRKGLKVPDPIQQSAWEALGRPKTIEDAKSSYKALAHQFHPDIGGNTVVMSKLNDAMMIVNKMGIPKNPTSIRTLLAKGAEMLERPVQDVFKPVIKPTIEPLPLKQLPGYRERPGQAPAFGLSTKEIEPVGGLSESAKPITTEFDTLAKEKFGKDFSSVSSSQKQLVLQATKVPLITSDINQITKVGLPTRGVSSDVFDRKPDLLYGGLQKGVFTDSYILIDDKAVADKILNGILDKQNKSEIATLVKRGMTFPEAEKVILTKAKESIASSKDFPEYKNIIPTGKSELGVPVGIQTTRNYPYPTVFFRAGEDIVSFDVNRVAYILKQYPNAQFQIYGIDKPAAIISGGKRVGLIMPIKSGEVPTWVADASKNQQVKLASTPAKQVRQANVPEAKQTKKLTVVNAPESVPTALTKGDYQVGDIVTVKKLTGGGSPEKYTIQKFYNDSMDKPEVAVLKSAITGKTKNVSIGSIKKVDVNSTVPEAKPTEVKVVSPKVEIPKVPAPTQIKPTKTIIRETTGQVKPKELKQLEERLRQQAFGARKGFVAGKEEMISRMTSAEEEREFLDSIKEGIKTAIEKEKNSIRKQIGFQRHTKLLDSSVQQRLKKYHGVTEWKNATKEQLSAVLEDMKKLQTNDSFLTPKQITGLEWYLKEGKFNKPDELVTKREMVAKFKDNEELMNGALTKYLSNNAFPTVDIKEGHPIIERIVDKADMELRTANEHIIEKNTELETLLKSAEKSAPKEISSKQVGERIFKRLGGDTTDILTDEELKVIDYLKEKFAEYREALKLERYRKNYITHIEKTFTEKVLDKGIMEAVSDYVKPRDANIPIDIMLSLDNIIGSEKFFRYALERKGGIDPSTNIRKIFKEYSTVSEVKMALDKVLPEGQAAVQLLLQNRSAEWLKRFLQNLKGRGLDSKFRSGKMNWAGRIGDKIVDYGYIRLLALNIKSAAKNIIGGEVNSFVYQTIDKYLTGKYRLLSNPKKAYKIISGSGVLDGSYVEIAKQNIIAKGKKITDHTLYGLMEGAEYEIRGSYLLGEMTKEEWESGTLTPERFRTILNGIAITQGVYTKVDSPLFVQTVLGRAVVQFGRWKITNSLLVRRIAKGMTKEVAEGKYRGEYSRKMLKMLITAGTGMYLAYELGKAGYEEGKKIAQASSELIRTIYDLATLDGIYNAMINNPEFQTFGAITFSIQELANYISFGMIPEPQSLQFRSGVEDSYVAAFNTLGINQKGATQPNAKIGKSAFGGAKSKGKSAFTR